MSEKTAAALHLLYVLVGADAAARGRVRICEPGSGRTLHLAGGGRAGHIGLVVLHGRKGVAGVFGVIGELAARLLPLRDVQALLQLVVALAHFDFAIEALSFMPSRAAATLTGSVEPVLTKAASSKANTW